MERNIDLLHKRRIIYRKFPENDKPTLETKNFLFYEDGTYECYELFRSSAKITTYKSLKWHLLVLWYLNPKLDQDSFTSIAKLISDPDNGFVTFKISDKFLDSIVYDVSMSDLDKPPKNKLRKVIFKDFCQLTVKDKLVIVGGLIGKGKSIHKDDVHEAMLDIHSSGEKITVKKIAKVFDVTPRTIYRCMDQELRKEKELLNREL